MPDQWDFTLIMLVPLPRGGIQEIKRRMLVNFTHGLFSTCTQKSHYISQSFIVIFTRCTAFPTNPTPCIINKTNLLYFLGEPVSLLVVTNTHPPLSFVCQQLPHPLLCPSHPFTPHSSNYIIYMDDINNLGHPCPGQCL
jgi:hypothetical protein